MKYLLLNIAIAGARFVYFFLKLMPIKDKVTFISRGNDFVSIDFRLLSKAIQDASPKTKIVFLNHPIKNKFTYIFKIVQEMRHIATSRAVVLDTYNIPVSVLKHKKSLIVLQIWHALGAFKSFGLAAIDKDEGSPKALASTMRMHKNYTYVSAVSKPIAEIYKECFGVDDNQIVLAGSPRVDYLKDTELQFKKRRELRDKYGISENKQVILFAPTFRKDSAIPINELIKNIDLERYALVFRGHPLDNATQLNDSRIIVPDEKEGIELLAFADHLITDYSAIVFEASVLDIPCYFWAYDQKQYAEIRGFILDFSAEAPGPILPSAKEIVHAIESQNTNQQEKVKIFKEKYVQSLSFDNSAELAQRVLNS